MTSMVKFTKREKKIVGVFVYIFLFTSSFFVSKTYIEKNQITNRIASTEAMEAEPKTVACRDDDTDDDLAAILQNKIEEVNCIFGGCNSFF